MIKTWFQLKNLLKFHPSLKLLIYPLPAVAAWYRGPGNLILNADTSIYLKKCTRFFLQKHDL